MDSMIVKGLGAVDGTYACDLGEMVTMGAPGWLTMREQHRMNLEAKVLPADLGDALRGMNPALMVTLAAIVLERHGKTVNTDRLWEATFVYAGADTSPNLDDDKRAVAFLIAHRDEAADEDPPAIAPTPIGAPSENGGTSSSPTSAPPVSDPSPTGHPRWGTPSPAPASTPQTSAI